MLILDPKVVGGHVELKCEKDGSLDVQKFTPSFATYI